ncbi:MAG: tRNA (guanosine(46)-N7)-methyltransferase TrmB [Coriobacteriales bacterium]|jgi:tRNA (guanine-N7-)-methyltransferase
MRARKPKHYHEKLIEYGDVVESNPGSIRGKWRETWMPGAREVRLDLGCGKGSFTVKSAMAEPDVLFIGIDYEEICISSAAGKAHDAGIHNAVFAIANADEIESMFSPAELELIYLNFCTPFTKGKKADERLTYVDRLMTYRKLLSDSGKIRFKTDSQPLFDFSLTQFELAGYVIQWQTRDLHADNPNEIESDFESRLIQRGAKIHALLASKGPEPESVEQTAKLGLVYYLPENLDEMDYVPYGMEDTVANMKNKRKKLEARAKRHEHQGRQD